MYAQGCRDDSMHLFDELIEPSDSVSIKSNVYFSDEVNLEWRSYSLPLHKDRLELQKKSSITTDLFF